MSEVLHLRCGSDIRDSLRMAKIAGDFCEWADPVCQGPVRALAEEAYLEERRSWLSAAWEISRDELDGKLVGTSTLAPKLAAYAEVCLWFEHDLYDQSILMQVLAALAETPALHDRLRMVSIDRHPELRRFIGLGQLRPEQLAALYPQRIPIAPEAFSQARRAWDAWREPSADRLRSEDWRSEALPFLAGAIDRHLEEFPGEDGLGLTQRLALRIIAELEAAQGFAYAAQVFGRLIESVDPAPWVGDLMFWAYLRELARGEGALITMIGEFPAEQLALTEAGRAVLAGARSWLATGGPGVHGPSRWRGGVEILG